MVQIIPSILTRDEKELGDLLAQIEGVERVHVDVMDGKFVDNTTITPSALKGIETQLLVDYHLSTKEPVSWVERCVEGRAERIIGHIEDMESQEEFVARVVDNGVKAGLAVDIETDVTDVDVRVLLKLSVVLLMSYPTGFGGQKFDDRVLDKIGYFDKLRRKKPLNYAICVDGGIDEKTIGKAAKSGADEVVMGRLIFKGSFRDNLEKFRGEIDKDGQKD